MIQSKEAYFSYSREFFIVDDKLPTESADPLLLLPCDDPAADVTGPDEAATFCDDELLVRVLKAFIHLVFMPAPVLVPPDKLNLLPRWFNC